MYVAVEGCIGSGKTTVSKLLADIHHNSILLEEYRSNPFLSKFYINSSKYALETELAFILIHYHQILHEMKLQKSNYYVTDFCIFKDLLFAEINLKKG